MAMWSMLQQDQADTFVLATGRHESVRTFVEMAFSHVGREIDWSGTGDQEQGRDRRTGEVLVAVNPAFYRPAEVDLLIGDAAKAREQLGWSPETGLEDLCKMMVDADLARNRTGRVF